MTSAKATTSVLPAEGLLGVSTSIQSYTDTKTHSQTYPRPSILVEFNGDIQSWGETRKQVFFDEGGFRVSPAVSRVQSQIRFYNLQTSAWGLFWRLKSKIAYRKAYQELMNRKAHHEAVASQTLATRLNSEVDAQTSRLLAPLQKAYLESFYTPFILGGGMKGKLSFQTKQDRFRILHRDHIQEAVSSNLSEQRPVEFKMSPDLFTPYFSHLFADQTLSAWECLTRMSPSLDPKNLPPELSLPSLQQIQLFFAKEKPIEVEFDKGALFLVLSLKSLKALEEVRDFKAKITGELIKENGLALLDLDKPIRLVKTNGEALSLAEQKFATQTLRKLFPAVIIEVEGKTVSLKGLTLKIREFALAPSLLKLSLEASH